MITDANLTLSSDQAVTTSAVSTNTIDFGPNREVAAGGEVHVIVPVGTTVTAAGAATVQFQLITSASADLSTPTVLSQSDAIPKANLVAGAILHLPIPRPAVNLPFGQRYFGVNYLVATGPLTAGKFSTYVVNDLSGLPPGAVYAANQNIK